MVTSLTGLLREGLAISTPAPVKLKKKLRLFWEPVARVCVGWARRKMAAWSVGYSEELIVEMIVVYFML